MKNNPCNQEAWICFRPLVLLLVAICVGVIAQNVGYGATYTLKFGAPYASLSNIGHSTTTSYWGAGSWYEQYPSTKTEIYVDPMTQFGTSFTIDQIQSITYHTVNGANNPSGVDFYLVIYTALESSGNDASWYNKRLNAEPYLSNNYVPPTAGQWNTWTTNTGSNQLTFFDATNCGNFGFYGAPTLADLQAGAINWSTWAANPTKTGANTNPIDYGAKTVKFLSWQTGSGWASFAGYLDAIEVRLTNGDIFLIDLESTTDPVYVDDDWSTGAPGVEISPGKYFGFNAFAKVQDGVNYVAGSTVYVAPGTYEEQIEITKSLTLQGAGASSTTIKSPVTLTKFFTTPGPNNNKPVIYVHDAAGVTIDGFTVDGAGRGNANYRFIGVAYRNAGGSISNCTIKDVRDNPISGTQHGIGIYAFADSAPDRTLNVSGNTILGFQKNGTVFAGPNLTVNATGNTIIGAGPVNFIAQNGLQLSSGATGSLTDNVVSGITYTGPNWSATGILIYGASGLNNASGNTVTNAMVGIWYINSEGSATGNSVTYTSAGMGGIPYWWGIVLDPGEGSTRQPAPSVVDGEVSNKPSGTPKGGGANGPMTVLSVSANHNYVNGGGNGAGIEADALGTESLSFTANKNCVTQCDAGIVLYRDPGATLSASVNYNSIFGNAYGLYDFTGDPQDATNNWWGCDAGPGNTGCDNVVGTTVNYTPWLSGVAVNAGADGYLYIGYGPTSLTLTASPSGGTGTYSYLWSPGGATTSSITVSTSIGVGVHTFTVTVTDETGCNAGSDAVVVTVEDVRCGTNGDKVRVLHNNKVICVAPSAVPAHLAHGDVLAGIGKFADRGQGAIPAQFALEQNYPNPFNPSTVITYALPVDAHVSIEVYNVLGQKVAQLVEENLTAGYHTVPFDASTLASGIYMYRMTAQGSNGEHFVQVKKLMVTK